MYRTEGGNEVRLVTAQGTLVSTNRQLNTAAPRKHSLQTRHEHRGLLTPTAAGLPVARHRLVPLQANQRSSGQHRSAIGRTARGAYTPIQGVPVHRGRRMRGGTTFHLLRTRGSGVASTWPSGRCRRSGVVGTTLTCSSRSEMLRSASTVWWCKCAGLHACSARSAGRMANVQQISPSPAAAAHLGGPNLIQQLPHARNLLNVKASQHQGLRPGSGSWSGEQTGTSRGRLGLHAQSNPQAASAWHRCIIAPHNLLTGSKSRGFPCCTAAAAAGRRRRLPLAAPARCRRSLFRCMHGAAAGLISLLHGPRVCGSAPGASAGRWARQLFGGALMASPGRLWLQSVTTMTATPKDRRPARPAGEKPCMRRHPGAAAAAAVQAQMSTACASVFSRSATGLEPTS